MKKCVVICGLSITGGRADTNFFSCFNIKKIHGLNQVQWSRKSSSSETFNKAETTNILIKYLSKKEKMQN